MLETNSAASNWKTSFRKNNMIGTAWNFSFEPMYARYHDRAAGK